MGYRDSITKMTDARFESSYEEAHRMVRKLIEEEWTGLVGLLEGMLRQTDAVHAA
jgi:hypothetical protein